VESRPCCGLPLDQGRESGIKIFALDRGVALRPRVQLLSARRIIRSGDEDAGQGLNRVSLSSTGSEARASSACRADSQLSIYRVALNACPGLRRTAGVPQAARGRAGVLYFDAKVHKVGTYETIQICRRDFHGCDR
jgi:hypothetical protein